MGIVWHSLDVEILLTVYIFGGDYTIAILVVVIFVTNSDGILSFVQNLIIEPNSVLVPDGVQISGQILTIYIQRLNRMTSEFDESAFFLSSYLK
jgi:hypothetical protein